MDDKNKESGSTAASLVTTSDSPVAAVEAEQPNKEAAVEAEQPNKEAAVEAEQPSKEEDILAEKETASLNATASEVKDADTSAAAGVSESAVPEQSVDNKDTDSGSAVDPQSKKIPKIDGDDSKVAEKIEGLVDSPAAASESIAKDTDSGSAGDPDSNLKIPGVLGEGSKMADQIGGWVKSRARGKNPAKSSAAVAPGASAPLESTQPKTNDSQDVETGDLGENFLAESSTGGRDTSHSQTNGTRNDTEPLNSIGNGEADGKPVAMDTPAMENSSKIIAEAITTMPTRPGANLRPRVLAASLESAERRDRRERKTARKSTSSSHTPDLSATANDSKPVAARRREPKAESKSGLVETKARENAKKSSRPTTKDEETSRPAGKKNASKAKQEESAAPATKKRAAEDLSSPAASTMKPAANKKVKAPKAGTDGGVAGSESMISEGPPDEDRIWPPGWIKRTFVRKSGKTTGQTDRYWYPPELGRRLRSMKEVDRYLTALAETNDPEIAWRRRK